MCKDIEIKKGKIFFLMFFVVLLLAEFSYGYDTLNGGLSCKTLQTIARVKMSYGRYDEAERFAEKALQKALKRGKSNRMIAVYAMDLSYVYMHIGLLEDAEQLCKAGIKLQKKEYGERHPYIGYSLRKLGNILCKAGKFNDALITMIRAEDIINYNHPGDAMVMAPFEVDKGKILFEMGKYVQAEKVLLEALDVIENSYGSQHLYTARVKGVVAEVYVKQGRYKEAEPLIRESNDIRKNIFGQASQIVATDKLLLAEKF